MYIMLNDSKSKRILSVPIASRCFDKVYKLFISWRVKLHPSGRDVSVEMQCSSLECQLMWGLMLLFQVLTNDCCRRTLTVFFQQISEVLLILLDLRCQPRS